MNSMLNHDRDEDIEDLRARGNYGKDREITLGTTMLLGIFFALAVFGAVFFGFGYSMGAKHAMTVASTGEATSSSSFSSFKPAPGNPLASALAEKPADKAAGETVNAPFSPTLPIAAKAQPVKPVAVDPVDPDAGPIPDSSFSKPVLRAAAAAVAPVPVVPVVATPATASSTPGGQFMVQVAAVSHSEDADLLVSTLKRRGYAVAVHTTAQDKLLHVQIGAFANRKDADAMRQRLLSDGFNAIVK